MWVTYFTNRLARLFRNADFRFFMEGVWMIAGNPGELRPPAFDCGYSFKSNTQASPKLIKVILKMWFAFNVPPKIGGTEGQIL